MTIPTRPLHIMPVLRPFTPLRRSAVEHPVFRYWIHDLKWAADRRQMFGYLFIGSVSEIGTIAALSTFFIWSASASARGTLLLAVPALYLFMAVTLATFIGDVRALLGTLPGLQAEIASGRWLLLRVTPLPAGRLVRLRFAAAQMRMWRMQLQLTLARAFALMLALLLLVAALTDPQGVREHLGVSQNEAVFVFGAVAIVALPFLFEGVWRQRAIIALALFLSLRLKPGPIATLTGLVVLGAYYAVQAAVLAGLYAAVTAWLSGPGSDRVPMDPDALLTALLLALGAVTAVLMVLSILFNTGVQVLALAAAARTVARSQADTASSS
jgi:hypothetical protein